MIKGSNIEFYADKFEVIGLVSSIKEYKIAWILNNSLNIHISICKVIKTLMRKLSEVYQNMFCTHLGFD